MRVNQTAVCLDCDELFDSQLRECPICLNKSVAPLRLWFPSLESWDEHLVKAKEMTHESIS